MSYSDMSDLDPGLEEVSFYDVQEGDTVFFEGTWYKALENSHVENGFVGFLAESEDFKKVAVQVRKNDMGYNSRLLKHRVKPTPTESTDPED
jgi:hypothetical protein